MSVSTVSATGIQDPTGQVFANGTWSLYFTPTYGRSGPFTDGGVVFTKIYGGSLDATGSFSQANVNRNDTISPGGSTWLLQVQPAVSGQTFQVALNVNSPAFDCTAAINAAITAKIPGGIIVSPTAITRAYKDAEVINIDGSGGIYYDETLKVLKVWDAVLGVWVVIPITGGVFSGSQFFAGDGSAAAPAYSFTNSPGTGLYNVAGTMAFADGGAIKSFFNGNINLATNGGMYLLGGAQDTSISRPAASVIAIGNGTNSDTSGTVKVQNLSIPTTSNTLPAAIQNDGGGAIQIGTPSTNPALTVGANPFAAFSINPASTSLVSNPVAGQARRGITLANDPAGDVTMWFNSAQTGAGYFFKDGSTGIVAQITSVGIAAGTPAAGKVAGDISAARSATSGAVYVGSDGLQAMFRSSSGVIEFTGTSTLILHGATSGTTSIQPTAVASGTLTLPAATDQLVGRATTDNLSNKTLNQAASANAINFVDNQAPTGAITGNGTDLTIYTKTIPAGQIQAGRGFRLTLAGANLSGAATGTLKIIVGGTTTLTQVISTSSNFAMDFCLMNAAGVQNSQTWDCRGLFGASGVVATFGTAAENFANAITVKATFNIVNPNTFQGNFWLIETIL